jgi:hypothetical protein
LLFWVRSFVFVFSKNGCRASEGKNNSKKIIRIGRMGRMSKIRINRQGKIDG